MRRLIPYPLLLVLAIILDRVTISSTQIEAGQSLRSLFILLLLTSLTLALMQWITRDWSRSNFMVLMLWAMLLLYRYLYRLLKIDIPQQADAAGLVLLLALFFLYILLVSRKLWQSVRNPAWLTYYCTVVCALLVGFQVFRLARDSYKQVVSGTHPQAPATFNRTDKIDLKSGTPPDIYVIILDGYARQDVLESMYQYDNSAFIRQLEKLGFYVAGQSHSNYVQTAYTMASLWNFDYISPWNSLSDYPSYLLDPIQSNRTFQLLDELGYTTVSFESEIDYTEIKNSDVYLSSFLPLNKFESLLLVDSPLEPLNDIFKLQLPIPSYQTHIERTRYDLQTLREIPDSIPGPKVVYAHIVAPHPPFVFDRNGNATQGEKPYSLWDNASSAGSIEAYKEGYVNQLIFINREILEVISSILARSERPPVILLMGDHGPASMFNWRLDEPGCIWERTSNLYAMLLPGREAQAGLYPSMTPVNTFRLIFNTYFDTKLPLLDDQTYLMSWQQPSLNINVTDKRAASEACIDNVSRVADGWQETTLK